MRARDVKVELCEGQPQLPQCYFPDGFPLMMSVANVVAGSAQTPQGVDE